MPFSRRVLNFRLNRPEGNGASLARTERRIRNLPESREQLVRAWEPGPEECLDVPALAAYVSGQLGRRRRARIARHIGGCPACLLQVDYLLRDENDNLVGERFENISIRPRRRGLVWGAGFGAAATATLVTAVILMTARPALHMRVEYFPLETRSTTAHELANGGVLHEGNRFLVEVTAARSGFLFVYAWNAADGGTFLYPEPGTAEDNYILEGATRFVPGKDDPWVLRDVDPGEHVFYLLYSARQVPPEELLQVSNELGGVGRDREALETALKGTFSISQQISSMVR